MIEVSIIKDKVEIGRINIEMIELRGEDQTADYSVLFAVERIGAVGLHRRVIRYFPRLQYNVLGLLRQALETLDPKELALEPEVGPSDLARRQQGVGTALPRQTQDPFSHH